MLLWASTRNFHIACLVLGCRIVSSEPSDGQSNTRLARGGSRPQEDDEGVCWANGSVWCTGVLCYCSDFVCWCCLSLSRHILHGDIVYFKRHDNLKRNLSAAPKFLCATTRQQSWRPLLHTRVNSRQRLEVFIGNLVCTRMYCFALMVSHDLTVLCGESGTREREIEWHRQFCCSGSDNSLWTLSKALRVHMNLTTITRSETALQRPLGSTSTIHKQTSKKNTREQAKQVKSSYCTQHYWCFFFKD